MSRLVTAIVMATSLFAQDLKPPVATVVPQEFKNFGDTRVDNYYYLRDRNHPETLPYLQAENAYTDALFQPVSGLVDKLYKEFIGRLKQTDMSAPYRRGPYFYYSRTVEGLNYPIHCRKLASLEGTEEILFDVNALAKGHKFFSLAPGSPDPAHRRVLFSTDTTGYREYALQIKDLKTGTVLPDRIERTDGSAWAEDGAHVFYVKQQEKTKRSHQVWRHEVGTPIERDVLIYEEKDDRFNVGISKTLSKGYLLIGIQSGRTSEWRYLDATKPLGEFKVLLPRNEGITYDAVHHGDSFYVRINDTARNFRVVAAPVNDPGSPAKWREVLAGREGLYVEDHLALKSHLVFLLRVNGLHTLRVMNLPDGATHDIPFTEQAYSLSIGQNAEFDTPLLRFNYSSMVTPQSVFDYDLTTRSRVLVKRQEVLGGYDPTQYMVERVMVTSHDGVRVPMTIAYKKGFQKNGQAPALLYGYGAYSIPMDPSFSAVRLSLLDRGFAYAIAHIRGGTDLGWTWYEDGKLLKKKNTFRDFIACAEFLIANKFTTSKKLAIEGGSAGGLLVGAAVTMRPELFNTVVAAVPFVDVINSLLDDTIPLTTTDADEFGSPKKQEYYEYQKSYSPYDNTRPAKYPNIYIFSSLNDSQVPYWEPAKWTAQLRTVNQSDSRIALRMNMDAGHGGASGRYERYKEVAQSYAFVLWTLGLKD